MSFILLPSRVRTPLMRLDSDDYHRLGWTRQPGDDGFMHVEVVGPSDVVVPSTSPAPRESLGPIRLAVDPGMQGPAPGNRLVLRDYQRECVESIEKAWRANTVAPLVILPTGAGKTIIASAVMDGAYVGGLRRSVFCAHRRELLTQTVDKIRLTSAYEHMRPNVGVVQGTNDQLDRAITVASIQTLGGSRSQQRLRRFIEAGPYHILIVDEAHHAVSPQYLRVINALREAYPDIRLLGMTATPGRADGTALDTVFDEVVFERNLLDMIAAGYLVPPKGYKVDLGLNLDQVKSSGGDYVAKQLSKLMNQPQVNRAVVEAWRSYGHNRKTIAFCVDVAHAQMLCDEFRDAGYVADYIYGSMKDRARDAALKRFREGETKVLLNCFDMETELLTKRGWVSADTVRADDVTAAVDMNGRVAWEPIRHITRRERDHGERMMHVSNQRLDIRVTEGHRMVFAKSHLRRWQVAEARTLERREPITWLPLAGTAEHRGVSLSDAELKFIGLFLSDGHMGADSRGITIHSSDAYRDTLQPKIEGLLSECGFDWKRSSAPGGVRYRIPIGNIGGALKRAGYHRLTPFLTKGSVAALEACTSSQFWALLEGLWLGDGTKEWTRAHKRSRSLDVWSTDRSLLDQLQAMAIVRGFAANISGPRDNGENRLPMHRIRVRPRNWCATNLKGRHIFKMEPGWRKEEVWCVTNSTGTVIARRNGKAFVSGQCEIATEGFDEASIECVLFARPTQSQTLYIQCLGRGLRPYPTKTECIVIDCVGNSDKHRPVQLASIAGFDPERRDGGSGGSGDGTDDDDIAIVPTVISTDPTMSEVDLTAHRNAARYPWIETKLGWVLNIPRIGYYLVAWSTAAHTRCIIRFYDQRPGRRQSLPLDVVAQPIDFQLAYGLVEAEMDRIFNARAGRSMMRTKDGSVYEDPRADRREFREFRNREPEEMPEVNFVDLDEGTDEQLDISEDLMQRGAQWRTHKSTPKQKDLLRKLGVKEKSLPELAGEASDLITILRLEKDAKMRMPMTPKQIAYFKVNELSFPEPATKGTAATIIWKHRKATGH